MQQFQEHGQPAADLEELGETSSDLLHSARVSVLANSGLRRLNLCSDGNFLYTPVLWGIFSWYFPRRHLESFFFI